jgi:GxxExxY protein
MTCNEVARVIVDVALTVHRKLGPGLLESVYSAVLTHELRKHGLRVLTEVGIAVQWEEMVVAPAFRADLIVEDLVIVEIKSVDQIAPVHKKQLLTYLKFADKRLGLLLNFGAELLKNNIVRVANGLEEP